MFVSFIAELKAAGVPVSLREYLALMAALDADLAEKHIDDFYFLARTILVKDEKNLDRFDRVFAHVFAGAERLSDALDTGIPEEWLKKLADRFFTEQEKAEIAALGGWDKLIETLKERLKEQHEAHHGGSKWIGTGGTSPFGAYGYNPEGIRIGQDRDRMHRAVKAWDRREFRDLDHSIELGTRNIKVALRRLRRFARAGAADELDLDGTIDATARSGWLDVKLRPERHNAIKLLVFFDVGGSMDEYVRMCEELFSAAKSEFKTLEYFYFHNCLYEGVWKDNSRRHTATTPTFDILRTYARDYRVILVGDATMSPYELTHIGGSVEHFNEEPGIVWLERLVETFGKSVWLNPVKQQHWHFAPSIGTIQRLFAGRMFPLTLEGLDRAVKQLAR
ncbi:MAG: VWA domain-containing protein [Ancalomicrobiaceae bacterium]|nr:VWA domain-containing protein [Ancalomicrobiaceae bacterium]